MVTIFGEDFLNLGEDFLNLDRPRREGIVTIQFELGNNGGWGINLVCDFDRESRILQDWYLSEWICGFCPHIFVHDGSWRLEGKMLAGCVGSDREGVDTLVLPRLTGQAGPIRVRLSNLAPELEHIDHVELGTVPLASGEEIDVAIDGRPFVWEAIREIDFQSKRSSVDQDEFEEVLHTRNGENVIVLEARNTSEFETQMREYILGDSEQPVDGSITLQFDDGTTRLVQPVGTKFLRRILVSMPRTARSVQISFPNRLWYVRRLWFGSGHPAQSTIVWQTAADTTGSDLEAIQLLHQRDGQRIRLEPMQDIDLTFVLQESTRGNAAYGYLLRMSGYYEFLRSPGHTLPQ